VDAMATTLFATNRRAYDAILLLLRIGAAVVMFPHGAQKLLGWFGGPGFSGTVTMFGTYMHVPAFLAVVVMLVEFFGPILLVLGLVTRIAALGIAVDMLVAALMVHLPNGFFMNFTGQQKGEGIEYFIYALAINVALVIAGPGRYSLDARFAGDATPR
jgi:putative oxidoreductase